MNDKIKQSFELAGIPIYFQSRNELQAYCQKNISKIKILRANIKSLLEKHKELENFSKKIGTNNLVNLSTELWEILKLINN